MMQYYNYKISVSERCSNTLSRSRNKAGISRRKISEIIGVSESTVKSWEMGLSSPTIPDLFTWFKATGESIFRPMLDFMWPDIFKNITAKSDDYEIRDALVTYLYEVSGAKEIRKLHFLVFGEYGGSWEGILDMACAHAHTSLKNRYTVAEIIQNAYEFALANNREAAYSEIVDRPLLLSAINAAYESTDLHKNGYTIGLVDQNSVKSISSEILTRSRLDAKVTRRFIAKAMGKTERTIANWEEEGEPTFFDICAWFHILDKSLWHYIRSVINPSEPLEFTDNDKILCDELINHFNQSSLKESRKLFYLMIGRHGSNWSAVLEMLTEYAKTPLYQRIITARTIQIGYQQDMNDDSLCEIDSIPPNMENLDKCIKLGIEAAKKGLNSYKELLKL